MVIFYLVLCMFNAYVLSLRVFQRYMLMFYIIDDAYFFFFFIVRRMKENEKYLPMRNATWFWLWVSLSTSWPSESLQKILTLCAHIHNFLLNCPIQYISYECYPSQLQFIHKCIVVCLRRFLNSFLHQVYTWSSSVAFRLNYIFGYHSNLVIFWLLMQHFTKILCIVDNFLRHLFTGQNTFWPRIHITGTVYFHLLIELEWIFFSHILLISGEYELTSTYAGDAIVTVIFSWIPFEDRIDKSKELLDMESQIFL